MRIGLVGLDKRSAKMAERLVTGGHEWFVPPKRFDG
ncbi:MAG: hypothetical protein ACI9EF_003847 [Pseudohongiellaceae bacterium]|jgi:hypothetical protein